MSTYKHKRLYLFTGCDEGLLDKTALKPYGMKGLNCQSMLFQCTFCLYTTSVSFYFDRVHFADIHSTFFLIMLLTL